MCCPANSVVAAVESLIKCQQKLSAHVYFYICIVNGCGGSILSFDHHAWKSYLFFVVSIIGFSPNSSLSKKDCSWHHIFIYVLWVFYYKTWSLRFLEPWILRLYCTFNRDLLKNFQTGRLIETVRLHIFSRKNEIVLYD